MGIINILEREAKEENQGLENVRCINGKIGMQ